MELLSVGSRHSLSVGRKGSVGQVLDIGTTTGLRLASTRPPPSFGNSQRKRVSVTTTTCKQQNGRKQKSSSGRGGEEKRKDFGIQREILRRKSAELAPVGGRNGKESKEESVATAPVILGSGDGAISVAALQPLDEEYYPVNDLSTRSRDSRSATVQASADSSPFRRVTDIVPGKPGFGRSKDHSAGGINEGLSVRQRKRAMEARFGGHISTLDEEERVGAPAALDDGQDSSTEEDDHEDWVEVGLEDDGGGEDEDDEEADYWEGDLPPMTPEEEEDLLREAEMELAELRGHDRDGGREPGFNSAGLERFVDWELEEDGPAELRKEQSTSDQGWTSDSVGTATENKSGVESLAGQGTEWRKEGIVDEGREQGYEDGEIRIESKRIDLESRRRNRYFWDEDEEGDDEGGDDKTKDGRGVPAVMRCFDRAKIYVKAGDGGNGIVAFRREKFVPFGGPYGGNGGRGGHVYIEVDPSMNSLLPFRKTLHFRAGRGAHGGGKRKEGAAGADCTVRVPPGTVIREAGSEGKALLELTSVGQREMLLPGGYGGRGNAAFKSGRNNAPQLAELGEAGTEMWVELELKLVADVGIVGVPNAGKSTLLSAISAAKPEIANYPFTTLLPNLGVVALDYDATMVAADLPGLLEGAHNGTGLGHEFLRHTERCKVLVHVVDGMSPQPVEEFEAVRLELELFNVLLAEKPYVVAFNKMDIPEAAERWETFQRRLRSKGIEPFSMSAATQQGTKDVITAAHGLLKTHKEVSEHMELTEVKRKAVPVAEMVRKQRSEPIENFSIEVDKHTRNLASCWSRLGAFYPNDKLGEAIVISHVHIESARAMEVIANDFMNATFFRYFESVRRFQRVLSASGVTAALREQGIREGDTVIVSQMEFNWMDSEDMSALSDWKRGTRGSKVWPH